MVITQYFRFTHGLFGERGDSRESWQWQPTLTAHDPSPPITLEDAAAPATFNAAWGGAATHVAGVIGA